MAALLRLGEDSQGIVREIYSRKNQANASRFTKYEATVKIQAWFRGARLRVYLKYLKSCATTIQKIWRGFLARNLYRIILRQTVFLMNLNHYNQLATKVQKLWRGYFVRKYVFDFYGRKRYLEALQVKNEIIRSELTEFAEQQMAARKQEEIKNEKQRKEHEARKHHYLVSTQVMPGIYNSPFLPHPTETEYLLRSVCPLSHKKKKKEVPEYDPACVNYSIKVPKVLPPIAEKPKGPFREPIDVQKQRYKPFQPTLRVCTDFFTLEKARLIIKDEEWVTRINDNLFNPFIQHSVPYMPMLNTTSKYGKIPYGTKYFREEALDQQIAPHNFKTIVPPIPVFDKFNDTYSKGQV